MTSKKKTKAFRLGSIYDLPPSALGFEVKGLATKSRFRVEAIDYINKSITIGLSDVRKGKTYCEEDLR